ncbi:putative phosphomannomutase [Brevibacillus phage SecTim467]|uniref:Putative phosphomannomutase n=2 Tax=Jenstvirus jenst TaxID=1982225 RepID=A0A0K2CNT6_9CAUD|nr:putative phosphomannomutase [Brevibacillus phage Jenst]ALA07219.1 putative phosphomannomutase [Brevibacillus phage Jenst]ALA07436.1 putative phosphomannomutase [Brevibacillus phage SecTim467]
MKYDVDNIFTYHPPKEGQPEKYTELRAEAKKLANIVLGLCPNSAERTLALRNIEQAMFWANASIARNE